MGMETKMPNSKPCFPQHKCINNPKKGNPQHALKDKGVIDSECSRYMTGNMSYLSDFEELNSGYVTFGGNPKGGVKVQSFSVSQMCDKKNSVLFTDTEYLVLPHEFKLPDENQVLLKVPRENNMYNVNLKNIFPSGDLTYLFAKATIDESNLWHRRLGHINFKTMNKLVKGNLVRGLPTKVFENDNTCVACKKGKQHRASCKTKPVSSVYQPLYRLHTDLFEATFVKSLNKKSYFLVVKMITGIKREFSVPRTPQENGIADRKNRTLIEAARTMLADLLLPIPFWAEHNVAGSGPTWLFDIDTLTKTMNYQPVTAGNQSNPSAGFQYKFDAEKAREEIDQQYVLFPVWSSGSTNPHNTDGDAAFNKKEPEFEEKKPESEVNVFPSSSAQSKKQDDMTKREAKGKSLVESFTGYRDLSADFEDLSDNNINEVNVADITYSDDEDDVGAEADFNNLEISITVSPIPTTRVHKDHLVTQIIGDLSSATQTRSMTRVAKDQEEPKRVHQALIDPSWIKAMQEEILQFKMQKVWVLVDLPYGERAIGTKWVFRNKKDEKGIVVRNKARLVSQGHTQEKGIDYEEVFALVARIEAIRLFLAYASFMGFMMYQMDIKSAFLYGTIKEEVYVCQPLGFEDPDHPDKDLCKSFKKLMKDKFQMSSMGELTFFLGLQVKQKKDGIFISQDKYVAEILRKFGLTEGKSASTPIDTEKHLLKDPDGEDVDVHTYRSMIGSLMYLTSSRPHIIFAQTIMATSSIEAEYVAAASCCTQVLWIQNQLLDYGKQVGDLSTHTTKYTSPALTQKVFANMRRVGKGFSGVETPLFEGMLVAHEVGEGVADEEHDEGVPTAGVFTEGDVSAAHDKVQPQSPQPQPQPTHDAGIPMNLLQEVMDTYTALTRRVEHLELDKIAQDLEITKLKGRVKKLEMRNKGRMIADIDADADVVLEEAKEVVDDAKADQDAKVDESVDIQGRQAESQAKIYKINLDHANKVLSMQEDETKPAEVQEVVDVVTTTKLITEVVTAASTTITVAEVPVEVQVYAATIAAASTLTATPRRWTKGEPKPLKKQQQIKQDEKYARELEAELNRTIDWDEVIDHVNKKAKEDPAVKRYRALKRKPQTEAQARKNMILYLRNVAGFKMDYFKGMYYDDTRPIFEAKFNSNVAFLQNTKEQIKEEESRALKRINETLTEKTTKRQKLDDEVEELKRQLQIVPNDYDVVYTEATLLARKVPIVDYEIVNLNNKPYYSIIRADDTHQLYACLNLEESKKCTWSSKSQRLKAVRIMWCADHYIYNHTTDFVTREEVPTHKVHSRSDAKYQIDRINPPPPQAQVENVNVVFTRSGKFDDHQIIQKDTPPPIIVNCSIEKDQPIKVTKRKNTSIGARDARFGRGTQANEDAQGYLLRNHPARADIGMAKPSKTDRKPKPKQVGSGSGE
nr:retrovirus-related Pol polyprotein from transposon TNT 1-94 [Tanacetum cinerariifolium]